MRKKKYTQNNKNRIQIKISTQHRSHDFSLPRRLNLEFKPRREKNPWKRGWS